jgi:hypothetical protein
VETPEHLNQARLRSQARESFFAEVPVLSHDEVGKLLGADPNQCVRDGRIFSLARTGREVFPAFQFLDGHPRPEIAEVLRAFEGEGAWSVALWFNTPSGWLGGRRPLAVLGDEPDRVVDAARKTASPIEF